MNTETTKKQLKRLVDKVNSSLQFKKLSFNQQVVIKKHMSITGGNGRLCIQPTSKGYNVGLSGKPLENEMYNFMCDVLKKERPDKYGFPASESLPKWEVKNFEDVRTIVLQYAKTNK